MLAPPPRARSLIATIWGDILAPHGGEVWLSTLIRLLAPFGCNERLVRTSVFRLARDRWLSSAPSGRRTRYRLTASGAQRFAQAFRRVYSPPARDWDGRWEVVLVPDGLGPAARRSLRADLAWQGFARLASGVHARPWRDDAPGGGIPAEWRDPHRRLTVFEGRDVPGADARTLADQVDAAFDLGTLAGEYRRFLARFGGVAAAFAPAAPHDPEQGFVVRTLLVHEYRRVRLRDPQLPLALLPPDWPGAAAYSMCRDLYRRVQPLADSHLASALAADGDPLLPALPEFLLRFPPT